MIVLACDTRIDNHIHQRLDEFSVQSDDKLIPRETLDYPSISFKFTLNLPSVGGVFKKVFGVRFRGVTYTNRTPSLHKSTNPECTLKRDRCAHES